MWQFLEDEQIGDRPIVSADIHADRGADINRLKFSISVYLPIVLYRPIDTQSADIHSIGSMSSVGAAYPVTPDDDAELMAVYVSADYSYNRQISCPIGRYSVLSADTESYRQIIC